MSETQPQRLRSLAQNYTILLIDDEKEITQFLQELLGLFFKEVATFNDPIEALEAYKTKKFDIVLTDITMPKMDGLELAREIRKIDPKQPILVLTAHNKADFLLESIELDIDGYILKPLEKEKFFSTLEKVLEHLEGQKLLQTYYAHLEKEIEKKSEELKRLYYLDLTTGLPNISACMEDIKDFDGIIVIELDNFSIYNILYGYDRGELILKEFTQYLKKRYDHLYSLGEARFAILVKDQDLLELSRKIHRDILDFTTSINGFVITFTATIAFSDKKPLLQSALSTLDQLKKRGKNRIGGYDETISTLLYERIQKYLPLLKKSIEDRLITPYFQPVVNYKTKSIIYHEALARLFDEKGNVYPAYEFIEVAQLSGLIKEITKIMIEKSFQTIASSNHHLSINITFEDIEDDSFFPFLEEQLAKYTIEPSRITWEILEDSIDIDFEKSLGRIEQLSDMGFSLAIDDFGAKYSNFERIHKLNPNYLKIDGKYIKDIDNNPKSFEIVKAIANFAQAIDVNVVAEFVSSKEIADILESLGIEYMQGWYFGKAEPDIKETF